MKRIFDLVVSITGLFFLFPFIFFISLLVFLNIGFPVFFRQKRIGLNEEEIELIKFRTMTNERNSDGILLPNEQRVTKLGNILRKTSLDELPSLFNIIKGDLSLVGPRPLLVDYLPYYKEKHKKRHNVKPGLTGLAQINGRNSTTWDNRLNLDVQYVNEQSFMLDLKILIKTFFKVLKQDGVEGDSDLSIVRLDKDSTYSKGDNDD